MSLFKKIFTQKRETVSVINPVSSTVDVENLSLDDIFVHNFIKKGGKFLYCSNLQEVNQNLLNIIDEHHWEDVVCLDSDLKKLLNLINKHSTERVLPNKALFTMCEQLISDNGSVLFSSNQVHQFKLSKLPNHFIVLARTSQIVRTTSEALMAVRKNYVHDFPTNISSIKNYTPGKADEDFLSFGNSNAKNLYLLLLEDL